MDATLAVPVTLVDIDGDLREAIAPVDQPEAEEAVEALGQVACLEVGHAGKPL